MKPSRWMDVNTHRQTHANSSKCEKLLGAKTDNELKFEEHIRSIYKKASAKLNDLSRVAKNMCPEKNPTLL